MRLLIFGDVVGAPGREALTRALPDLRQEHQPDAVIVNIENIAHGKGITPQAVEEALAWQADAYTTGDHAWDNQPGIPVLEDKNIPIIRPANYPTGVPGRGYHIFSVGIYQVAVINLQGQVFFKRHPNNPFLTVDTILEQSDLKEADVVLIDFHAEATSEKRAMGWHADGRVTAVWGTHTHVPTADAQILPQGTGYITDVGMIGALNSIIGMEPTAPLRQFRQQIPVQFEPPASGPLEVNVLLLDVDPKTAQTSHIAFTRKILNDKE